jgi:hypothetical protein
MLDPSAAATADCPTPCSSKLSLLSSFKAFAGASGGMREGIAINLCVCAGGEQTLQTTPNFMSFVNKQMSFVNKQHNCDNYNYNYNLYNVNKFIVSLTCLQRAFFRGDSS